MMVAQQLYEGIQLPNEEAPVGLITYMRTDSVRVADQALDEVRGHIGQQYGADYVPEQANRFKVKTTAQDAHEAIRPTSMAYHPDAVRAHLTPDQYYLYRLIWNRFVASQMAPAVFDDTTVDITAADYLFRAKGSVPKFAGWLAVYQGTGEADESEKTEQKAPAPGSSASDSDEEADDRRAAAADRRRTSRRERHYARAEVHPAASTLQRRLAREGARRERHRSAEHLRVDHQRAAGARLRDQERRPLPPDDSRAGVSSTSCCIPAFDDILDVEYTARMEDRLDEIEKGKADYEETLSTFYKSFKKDLKRAEKEMPNFKEGQPTGQACDKCGEGEMVEKAGKFGIFLACSRYPDCDNTKELEPAEAATEELDETCENCGRPMVAKRGRFGMFLACTGYPECKTTRKIIATKQGIAAAKPDQILDEKCPNCGKNLVIKQGRFGEFTACTGYPECKYVKQKSTGVVCPKDGGDVVERKSRRGKVFYGCANYPKCDFTLWNKPILEPCPKCGWKFLTEKITKRHGRQLICANEDCDFVRTAELEEATVGA